jgi:hypothetical protein
MQLHHTLMSQYKHGTASGIGSVSYESVANCVTPEVIIYGKCVQNGTPTPDAPADIVCNNNVYSVNGSYYTIPELYSVDNVYQVGNVRDEYYPQTGKIVRRCAKMIVSSSASWTNATTDSRGICFSFKPDNVVKGNRTSICSHFKNVMGTWAASNKGKIGEYSDNDLTGIKYFRPPNESVDTLDKFKAWLDEQVAIGKPVTLVYVLAEPVIEYVDSTPFISIRSISVDDFEFLSVGDVKDEYNPQTNEIIKRCRKVILTSADNFSTYGNICFIYEADDSKMAQGTSICSHFENVMSAWGSAFDGTYGVYSDNNLAPRKYFRPPNESINTVESFKVWLDSEKAAGRPVTLVYQLANPITINVINNIIINNIIEETDFNSEMFGIPFVEGTQIDVKYLTHS